MVSVNRYLLPWSIWYTTQKEWQPTEPQIFCSLTRPVKPSLMLMRGVSRLLSVFSAPGHPPRLPKLWLRYTARFRARSDSSLGFGRQPRSLLLNGVVTFCNAVFCHKNNRFRIHCKAGTGRFVHVVRYFALIYLKANW